MGDNLDENLFFIYDLKKVSLLLHRAALLFIK